MSFAWSHRDWQEENPKWAPAHAIDGTQEPETSGKASDTIGPNPARGHTVASEDERYRKVQRNSNSKIWQVLS